MLIIGFLFIQFLWTFIKTYQHLNYEGYTMKTIFKKTNAILILIASMSIGLIGCGTGADSSGMGASSSQTTINL